MLQNSQNLEKIRENSRSSAAQRWPMAAMDAVVYEGDTLETIKTLPADHFDLLYTNPPFAITAAKWDKPLPWDELWPEIWRVMKPKGVVVLHCSMPFTYTLIKSQTPRYHYTWKKNNSTGHLSAKYQPLRICEEVLVFYRESGGTYNPQMTGDEFHMKRNVKHGGAQEYWGTSPDKNEETVEGGHRGRYPTTLLEFPIRKGKGGAATRHPDMVDYFIKTYSNKGDRVLDLTCYNAITGVRCLKSDRFYVGIDVNPHVDSPNIPVLPSPATPESPEPEPEPESDDDCDDLKPVRLTVTMKDGALHEVKLTEEEDLKKFAGEGEGRVWLGGKLKWVKEEDIEEVSGRKVDKDEVVKRLALDDESSSSESSDEEEWACSVCGRTGVPYFERCRKQQCISCYRR